MVKVCFRCRVQQVFVLLLLGAVMIFIYKFGEFTTTFKQARSDNVVQHSTAVSKDTIKEWQDVLEEINIYLKSPQSSLPADKSSKLRVNQSQSGLQNLRQLLYELTPAKQNRTWSNFVETLQKTKTQWARNSNELVIFMWPFKYSVRKDLYADRLMHCSKCADKAKTCFFTSNLALLSEAEATVLIASDLDELNMPPRYAEQKWIFFSRESPDHVKVSGVDLRNFDKLFNVTATYTKNSDIVIAYGKCVKTANQLMTKKSTNISVVNTYFSTKSKLAAWFVSSCKVQSRRERYVEKLTKANVTVDIYGKCGTLNCPASNSDCFKMLSRDYFFYFSFENSLCRDYVTEKVFKLFHSNTYVVPVVMGGANYSQHLPPNSYINVVDFKTPTHLAKYLTYLSKNLTAYSEYFKWKEQYDCKTETNYFWPICNYLHATRHQSSVVPSVESFWSYKKECFAPMKM